MDVKTEDEKMDIVDKFVDTHEDNTIVDFYDLSKMSSKKWYKILDID